MREEGRTPGGLIGWFAGNHVTVNLLMLLLLVGGLYVASTMNAQTFPDVDPRQITVSVAYRGATPEEVEAAVTRRVEEALIGIEGVERVRSTAAEGSGLVVVELKDFVDAGKVKDDVETAVDQIAVFPPADAERPRIAIAEAASDVLRLAVYGDLPELELRAAAERIEQDLLALEGINLVRLEGVRDREISIEVSEAALREYGLSFDQVAGAVNAASVDLSGGALRTSGGQILLRTDEERETGREFEDIVVRSDPSGRRVLLRDVASIKDAFEDDEIDNSYRGSPAAFIQIGRSDDQDAFDISEKALGLLRSYDPPPGVAIEVVSDQTVIIADRLNLLVRNAVMGLALVFVFLTFTLDLRLAFWTTLGIPISFMGAFLVFGSFLTITMPMLFGLIVVLGIVVDDAIVVGENIYEAQQRDPGSAHGAVHGTLGVAAPVTIGVITTVAAFAPLLFTTGTLGQILFPVPVVVISILLVSLLEAFFILPAHLSHAGDWSVGQMARAKEAVQRALAALRDRVVMPVAIAATRARYVTLAIFFAALIVTGGMVAAGGLKFVFFPSVEADEVSVSLEMAEGTAFERTEQAMDRVVAAAMDAVGGEDSPTFKSLSVTVGGRLGGGFTPGASGRTVGPHLAEATLVLAPAAERDISSEEVARRWREAVGQIPGAQSISFTSSLVGAGADVSINLSHADETSLAAAVERLSASLRGYPGVGEVRTNLSDGKRQLEFALTPAGSAAGLTTQDIARQVRQAFFGEEVQRIQRGREEVLVFVRYPADERRSLSDLDAMRIRIPGGGEVPLGVVASVTETTSPATIERVDGRRVVTLEADVDEAVTTPNVVNRTIEQDLMPALQKQDPQLLFSFEGQSRSQSEDLASLSGNLVVAVGIIFVLLASALRSYAQPLIIMAAIPFAALGAVWGHMLMGYDLSFLSLFGVVALTGVVINGSVVLLDHYNTVRAQEDIASFDAIMQAVSRRFRPIFLTTITTFLGLAPMLAETSLQARFLIPMAISLGFGILVSGFMILALVPVLVMIGHDLEGLPARFRSRRGAAPAGR